MMADATVDVPGVGKTKKQYVYAGVAGVAVLIGVYYYRQSKAANAPAAAAAAATSADQYPPDGTTGNPQDLYSTDPATGQTYGDEMVGSGSYGAGLSNQYGQSGLVGYDSSGNPVYAPGYGPGPPAGTSGGPPFSSNEQWSNWVIPQMTANDVNLDAGALTDALGAYLAGQPATPAQRTLIFDAIAIGGDPPVAGPNGYPPKVQSLPSGVTPPAAVPSVSGGHVVSVSNNDARIAWTGHNAESYRTVIHGPGAINGRANVVPAANASYSGLEARHTYDVTVTPFSGPHATGTAGPSGVITFVTR